MIKVSFPEDDELVQAYQLDRLFDDPRGIGMFGRCRDDDFPRRHAEPCQHVHLLQAAFGDCLHTKEITRPQGFLVSVDELIPGIRGPIRPRRDALLFQDVTDRLTTDLLDPHLAKLTNDTCVTKAGGLGDVNANGTNGVGYRFDYGPSFTFSSTSQFNFL